MTGRTERLQYWFVLAAQLFLLFIAEVMKDHAWLRLVFAGTMILVFGSVVRAIWSESKLPRIFATVFGVGAIICGSVGHTITGRLFSMHFTYQPGLPIDWMLACSMFSYAIFVGIAIFSIGRHIFLHDKVTANVIAGGICIYMLIGMCFAFCYTGIALITPDVFVVSGILNSQINLTDFFYFSYSVLTTVGFGDILARNGFARLLASIEAVTGCLFITVMITGLVGTYFAERKSSVLTRGH